MPKIIPVTLKTATQQRFGDKKHLVIGSKECLYRFLINETFGSKWRAGNNPEEIYRCNGGAIGPGKRHRRRIRHKDKAPIREIRRGLNLIIWSGCAVDLQYQMADTG